MTKILFLLLFLFSFSGRAENTVYFPPPTPLPTPSPTPFPTITLLGENCVLHFNDYCMANGVFQDGTYTLPDGSSLNCRDCASKLGNLSITLPFTGGNIDISSSCDPTNNEFNFSNLEISADLELWEIGTLDTSFELNFQDPGELTFGLGYQFGNLHLDSTYYKSSAGPFQFQSATGEYEYGWVSGSATIDADRHVNVDVSATLWKKDSKTFCMKAATGFGHLNTQVGVGYDGPCTSFNLMMNPFDPGQCEGAIQINGGALIRSLRQRAGF